MPKPHLDFLSEEDKVIKPQRKKLKSISKTMVYVLIVFVILLMFFGMGVISSGENLSKTFGNTNLWGQIKHLITSSDKELDGEDDDRINILLLGMGGLDHDGPFLTDTIMIASIRPSDKRVALISIPRDLSVNIPGHGWRKINNANAFGEAERPGQGGELAKTVISQTFNIPIHYYFRIDFAGFQQMIDDLGGITVQVENDLNDPFYPIKGQETATTSERYEHLVIEQGRHHMDGDLALKFVRSRQASGVEGSDFARSRRQQLVLQAVRDKALSFSTLINPLRISNVMDTLSEHIATNFEVWEIIKLANIGRDISEDDITRLVFDDSPDGFLRPLVTEEGAFILTPKSGNFSEMQLAMQYIFEPEKLESAKPKLIEIQNGTKVSGLAFNASQYLLSLGYQITRIKNAPTQDYQKTVVYDLVSDETDQTAETIAELFKADIAPTIPDWIHATTTVAVAATTDVLVILGQDRTDL